MKKKFIYVMIFIMILGIILISSPIGIIKRIKEFTKKIEPISSNENNITKIDITNLDSNIIIEHEHILKTKYNENTHWEECAICRKKEKEVNHSYTSSWTSGTYNNCSENNINKFVCRCGYSYESTEGRRAHNYVNTWSDLAGGQARLITQCGSCYYTHIYHQCKASSGKQITCGNLGTCQFCGYNYKANLNQGHHDKLVEFNELGSIETNNICDYCNNKLCGKAKYELKKISNNEYRINYTITVNDNREYMGIATGVSNPNISLWKISENYNGNTLTSLWGYKIIGHIEGEKEYLQVNTYFASNGSDLKNGFLCQINKIKEDYDSPTINEISQELLKEWSKTKQITISGTENYCNTVEVKILDDKENIIYSGTSKVTNEKYSVSCTPELEADAIGRTFTVIVTDNCNNSTSKEFTISKIDGVAPNPTSGTKVEGEWSKTKNFTFRATDEGIGNVSIAFNDIKDLQLANFDGNEYSREYEFTGDVYKPKELSVLYKDELGNASMQKITVDKLDNTAPTITNVSIHNNKLSITANDIKEGIGEGSGVSKYKYITSTEKIENPEIPDTAVEVNSTENIIVENISEVKYIYVVAEDLVGNISEIYEFEVPRVNINK